MKNPNSVLTKYLGIYEIKINNNSSVYMFITENLFGDDLQTARNVYDLKGSTFSRKTKVTVAE